MAIYTTPSGLLLITPEGYLLKSASGDSDSGSGIGEQTAPMLNPRAITYKQRVEADGGVVTDINFVSACYNLLDKYPNIDFTWISPYFGHKVSTIGCILKCYCLFGRDWEAVGNNVTIGNNPLRPNGLYYKTNNGIGISTITPQNFITTQMTFMCKVATNNPTLTLIFESSPNKNQYGGFLSTVESNYYLSNETFNNQNSLAAIQRDSNTPSEIPATIVLGINNLRAQRNTNIEVNGVANPYPYSSPYGNLDANFEGLSHVPQIIYMGTRNNYDFKADVYLSSLFYANKTLDATDTNIFKSLLFTQY